MIGPGSLEKIEADRRTMGEVYRVDRQPSTPTLSLSDKHARMLLEESGVDPEIAAERGYRTVWTREELRILGFSKRQRHPKGGTRPVPALVVPTLSPDGETVGLQMRPDTPRRNGDGHEVKYESPACSGVIVDCHPRNRARIRDASETLWITEGVKKGDALTSRGLCTLALAGVEMWSVRDSAGRRRLAPCFDHVALEGREVRVVFDSDVMVKPEVQRALRALVAALEGRGARVKVVYLPDAPDGSKQGVDDWLVVSGTIAELESMAVTLEPASLDAARLSRDDKLRDAIGGLRHRARALEREGYFAGVGGRTREAVYLELIETAARRGKVRAYGNATGSGYTLEFFISQMEIAESRGTRQPTVSKAVRRLEDDSLLERKPREKHRDRDRATVYAFRVPMRDVEGYRGRAKAYSKVVTKEKVCGDNDSLSPDSLPRCYTPLRGGPDTLSAAPTPGHAEPEIKGMRWSYTRRVRAETGETIYEHIRRLGKIRGAAVRHLVDAAGILTVDELASEMGVNRPRDLRRRTLPDLQEAGILTVDEQDVIRLTADWREQLQLAREIAGEYEQERLTLQRHDRAREARQTRDERPEDPSPSYEELDRARAEREHRRQTDRERPVSPLAAAIREYVLANPHRAGEPAGWLGTTVWALSLYDGKPTPAESKAAVEELGGVTYVRERLAQTAPGTEKGAA